MACQEELDVPDYICVLKAIDQESLVCIYYFFCSY